MHTDSRLNTPSFRIYLIDRVNKAETLDEIKTILVMILKEMY